MAWDDAKKQKAIAMYQESEPTPENSMEVVKEIAEKLGESANGVRMILSKAEVYIKKEAATAGTKTTTTKDGAAKTPRVAKGAAQESLKAALNAAGASVDDDIIDKLTGKAAQYFADIISKLGN